MRKRRRDIGISRTLETWMLRNGREGDIFFTNKPDKDITAMAVVYERKVSTEMMVLLSGTKKHPVVSTITKVVLAN